MKFMGSRYKCLGLGLRIGLVIGLELKLSPVLWLRGAVKVWTIVTAMVAVPHSEA